ncbi:alpha/beta fold hydrolase [Brevibacterium casei]|nr:alpha/beta fold hydrolase [Brevibacterium casei]
MPGLAHRRRPIDLGNPHPRTRGAARAGTLRGVLARTDLGYTSLVVTYRNTEEGPRVGTGRSTLGHTEAADVDEAIGYAVRRGARRIVLFGWSMGAAIALRLADRPRHEGLIAGLVLDSPVLDWTEVIKTNCTRAGSPAPARPPCRPVAHHRAARSSRWPTGPHSAPIVRLDRQSRRPRHAHTHPPRVERRLRADPALTSTPRRPPGARRVGDLRRRPHARLEHRPRPLAGHRHLVAPGSHLGLTARAETPLGTHLVRPRPEKPNSSRTSAGIIRSVGLPGHRAREDQSG